MSGKVALQAGLCYNQSRKLLCSRDAVTPLERVTSTLLRRLATMNTLPPSASNGNPQVALPDTSGVYKITCTANKKIYIGSTSNLCQRKRQHFDRLRLNKHDNPILQAAFNKYGEDAFTYEVIELTLPAFQLEREQYWFKKLKPFSPKGFNIARDATCPPSPLGRKATPKAIEVLRQRSLGNKYGLGREKSAEELEQMRLRGLGNKHGLGNKSRSGQKDSLETRQRKSQSMTDKPKSPEHRENIRQSRLGIKRSPETIERMRQSRLGKPGFKQTPESIEKTRQTKLAKKRVEGQSL
jgi:group I intron endonuclease